MMCIRIIIVKVITRTATGDERTRIKSAYASRFTYLLNILHYARARVCVFGRTTVQGRRILVLAATAVVEIPKELCTFYRNTFTKSRRYVQECEATLSFCVQPHKTNRKRRNVRTHALFNLRVVIKLRSWVVDKYYTSIQVQRGQGCPVKYNMSREGFRSFESKTTIAW